MRVLIATLTGLLATALGDPAGAADYKRITPAPGYEHDRWETWPTDHVKEFRAYISSFDTNDDDDGDGWEDLWGIPEFVAYEIKEFPGTLGKGPDRPSPWITDGETHDEGWSPTDATYKYSRAWRQSHPNWYVRGHLCMKQHAWRLGANADWNTHTMLNAVPQRDLFNRGIWLSLENMTASWADTYGRVWIIAGPIFNAGSPRRWLGEWRRSEMEIGVPDALFKVVVREGTDPDLPHVLAFIYPQDHPSYDGRPYDHTRFLESVDRVEELTGLDFLTVLPDADEEAIESVAATALWD